MTAMLLPLLGGILIGLAASLLLLFNGRVAGVSGIAGGLLSATRGELGWRAAFIGGLVGGGLVMERLVPGTLGAPAVSGVALPVLSGLLVGFGARLGNGCTSGHGVCGLSRGAGNSLVATGTFVLVGAVTVFLVRHVLGGR